MRRKAKRTVYLSAPVEQTWRIITGGNTTRVDPLDEDTYDNCEPGQGTVFTRSTEVVQNEKLAFSIKSRTFLTDWCITLEQAPHYETKMTVSEDVTYRKLSYFLLCLIISPPRKEIRAFIDDIKRKLDEDNGKKPN